MPTHQLVSRGQEKPPEEEICLFAQTNFRNQMRRFGIKTDDRRRHMYVIGKTGMGKTTMMENMVLNDIYKGHGVGIVDPHGDFAEKIIDYVPSSRINDIVYINPADTQYPIGFNILEVKTEEQKHLIAAGLMATFKKIWPDVWSSRMEYILNNTLLALLDYPGSTLLGINRMLGEKAYRKKVVRKLTDPVVKSFWQNEFENYEPRYQKEAVAPIQNKIGQFLSAAVIRNMVAQVKSTVDIRELMDSKKIIIMNLSKGRIGEDNCRLLGGMLVTKIQMSAMERVDTPEAEREDFFLYVDEFQNFATPSFANILSEARKYRLSLIMAHQYVAQLDEVVADAVFGNVGTIVTFRVGGTDAEALTKEFTPTFVEEDIVNLSKFTILLKLMIDGVASQPFSAHTMPPIGSPTGSAQKVIRVSRERYGRSRDVIEEKILRWSGMGELQDDDEYMDVDTTTEKKDKKNTDTKGGGSGDKKDAGGGAAASEKKDKKKGDTKKGADTKQKETVSLKELMSDADRAILESASGATAEEQTPSKKSAKEDKKEKDKKKRDKKGDKRKKEKSTPDAILEYVEETQKQKENNEEKKMDKESDVSNVTDNKSAEERVDENAVNILDLHFDPDTKEMSLKDEMKSGDSEDSTSGKEENGVPDKIETQEQADSGEAQPEKKKRKRRRKRKRKKKSEGGDPSAPSSENKREEQKRESPENIDPKPASAPSTSGSTKIQQDQIISFD